MAKRDLSESATVSSVQALNDPAGASSERARAWFDRLRSERSLVAMFGIGYYASQPPLSIPVGAFFACVCFVLLVAREGVWSRRQFVFAWMIGFVMWLLLLQGVRLAFWPLYAGWFALSLYLAFYLPLTLVVARSLYKDFRFPLTIACSVAWVGGEYVRSNFLTGFAGCLLAHSQTPWPPMLQVASQFGGYGVGFVVMFLSATCVEVVRPIPIDGLGRWYGWLSRSSALLSALLIVGVPWYGLVQRDQFLAGQQPIKPLGRFLLVQDNMPTMFDADRESVFEGWLAYERTTREAASEAERSGPIDVVVWPESIFAGTSPYLLWDEGPIVPDSFEMDRDRFKSVVDRLKSEHEVKVGRVLKSFRAGRPNLLLGTDVWVVKEGNIDRYNSALWVGADGVVDYYAKHHLVMFGEYIPVLSSFPDVMRSIGMGTLSVGNQPKSFGLKNGRYVSPNICFEDFVPHLIQSQISELVEQKRSPDLLVNLSNDGWFRGSSILDHQLNCAILMAVENRRPVLVAANTGLTAWIDGDGRVVKRLPRMEPGWILAEPIPDGRPGLWQRIGDIPAKWLAGVCILPWLRWFTLKYLRRRRHVEAG